MAEQLSELYPAKSTYAPEDWRVLAGFWHPIATSDEVSSNPVSVTLLDLRLVIYRTSDRLCVALDTCPHRGAQLSRGYLREDRLVCPYHGLHFDGAGACTLIPAQGPGGRIPKNLRLTSFQAVERYGIVWTSLTEEPSNPLPNWSLLEGGSVKSAPVPPEVWDVTAARHAENFNDIAHVAWVHSDTFGELPPEVPDYTLEQTDTGLRHYYHETGNNRLFERHMSPGDAQPDTVPIENVLFEYHFTYPFASSLEVRGPDGRSSLIFDVIQPISLKRSRIYKIVGRNHDLEGPIERAVDFEQAVNREDKEVIEPALPDVVALDPAKEFHIRADRWSMAYRRGLKKFGLGQGDGEHALN